MNSKKLRSDFSKILLLLLFFCLISLIIEIAFFNKGFFHGESNKNGILFDYYWIRHLAVFLLLILLFIIQKKRVDFRNLKPYSAFALLLVNIVPGISSISKYFFLFLSFLLFLYLKSNYNSWEYRKLLHKNLYVIIFFIVLFLLFFPLLLREGYVYDPLALYLHWPGYRLSYVSGLSETTGGASDLFDAFLPQWNYTYHSIREGTFPLWRFNKGLGIPQYEQSYHPEKLISFIVEPTEALTLVVLLKLFLCMMGMYFLLRAMKIREGAAIIGGIGYALSGFVIGWLHGPQSSVSYHIPFFFLFLIRYLDTKKMKFLFYFALWSGLIIYSGFLPIAGYSFYGIGLFLILFYVLDKRKFLPKVKEALKISLYWVLGMMIVSFHFLSLYYSIFISRSFDISYRHIGKVPYLFPKYFKNIIFPSYYGWEITPEIRPYVSSTLILFLISGLIILALKFRKFSRKFIDREKNYFSFLLLLVPFSMAMFGIFPFYQISCKLPVLNSSPLSRLQSMTCFLLVILGIKGLELFLQTYGRILGFYRRRKHLFLAVTGILFLSVSLIAMTSLISDEETKYHTVYPVLIFASIVILAFQSSIWLRKNAAFFLIFLLLLVSVETLIQNRQYVTVNKKIHFITEVDVPLVDFLKRNLKKYEGILVFDSNFNTNGTLGNYGIREKIVHQFFHPDHKALIVDTFSEESFMTPTAPALSSSSTDFSSSLIQLMGVKYLVFRNEFTGNRLPPYYKLVYGNLDGKVYENNLYKRNKGIFFCKPEYFTPEDKEDIIRKARSMEYSRYVYIESDKELRLMHKDRMSCSIRIMAYTPNKVIYRYQANSDGILTFPEAYNRDWSVTVNGKKRKVLRTNLIFRGVAVKEGEGEIVFQFKVSTRFKILVLIGFISLLSLLSLYILSERLNRVKEEEARIK